MKLEITEINQTAEVIERKTTVLEVFPTNLPNGILETNFTQLGGLLVGTGPGTFIELAPGDIGEFLQYDPTVAGGLKSALPSITIEDASNALANGGFNIAQRQTPGNFTGIRSSKYSADRWRVEWEMPAAAAAWQATHNYALNDLVVPTVYNGLYYRVSVDAGSSGGSQPTWPLIPGVTVVDGGITWTCVSGLQYARQDGSAELGLHSPYFGQWKRVNASGKFLIMQPISGRDSLKFRNQTVIFQCQMKASAAKTMKMAILELQAAGTSDVLPAPFVTSWAADGTDPTFGTNVAVIATSQAKVLNTNMVIFSFSNVFPATSKNLICAIWTDSKFADGDTFSIGEAGLYYGSSQKTWTPVSVGLDLFVCQRRYEKSYPAETVPGSTGGPGVCIADFPAAGTATCSIPITFKVAKAGTPTVTVYDEAGTAGKASSRSAGTPTNGRTATLLNQSENGVIVQTDAAGGSYNGVQFYWTAEIEL